jgi:hypothetical protein
VKENYLYFHISSWKASGKSAEAFGRYAREFFPFAVTDCFVGLTAARRAIEQALLDMQEVCQPKKKMARKNSEQALDLLAH